MEDSRTKRRVVNATCLGVRLSLLAVALALGACQSSVFKPNRWAVEVNPLDYVQFACAMGGAGKPATTLKVELLGAGHLTCWEGRSPRVRKEFWAEREDDRWDEYDSDSVHVSATYVHAIFQRLVDTGFFESQPFSGVKEDSPTGILVSASINDRRKAAMTDDPKIRAIVQDLLKQF